MILYVICQLVCVIDSWAHTSFVHSILSLKLGVTQRDDPMINTLKQDLRSTREDPRDQVKSKHEDWNQAVCEIAKKRAHCGDRTLDRTLDKQPDAATGCWVETRQTGDWTRGPDAGGNRPDAETQRPIEYREVQCPVVLPASGRLYELVSSRSCVRLSFYLHAWTLLDILGLFLCS